MELDINELLNTATSGLDLSNFKGDVVAVKMVENEINYVADGGIGVQKNYYNGNTQDTQALTDEEKEIVSELKTVFWGDEEEATKFLHSIRNMKNKEITQLVKKLVEERKISDQSCNRPLWTILNKHKLYTATESNWNSQLK